MRTSFNRAIGPILTVISAALIALTSVPAFPRTVSDVTFSGSFRIKEWILLNELEMKPGAEFSPAEWKLDRKRLASLAVFSEVATDTISTADGITVAYNLKEQWTLIPRLNIGGEIDNIDIDIGLSDKDFLGLYVEPGVMYSHFENRSSYYAWLNCPRAVGTRYALSLSVSETHSREPADIRDEVERYHYDVKKTSVGAKISRRFTEKFSCGIGLSLHDERYRIEPYYAPPRTLPEIRDQKRIRPTGHMTFGRVYYDRFFSDGQSLTIGGDLIAFDLDDYRFKYWLFYTQMRNYVDIDKRWNICNRLFFGTSKIDDVFPTWAITGFSNVRGTEDRVSRGSKIWYSNNEVRLKVYEDKWFHGQLTAFVDFGDAWEEKRSLKDIVSESYMTCGLGLRLGHFRFYNAIGRVDFAYNANTGTWTTYISAGQFF